MSALPGNRITAKTRGVGLDLRTRPDSGGSGGGGGDADAGLMNKLQSAVQSEFGVKPIPGEEDSKKKLTPESGADGTTQNGSTNSRDPGTGRFAGRTQRADTGTHADDGSNGDGQAPQKEVESWEADTADGAGGSGGDGETDEAPTLDPLELLNRPLPEEKAEDQPGAGAETEAKPEVEAKPEPKGGQLRAQLEKTLAENKALSAKLKEVEGKEDPRIKDLTSAWEQEKKAREELEQKIAFLDYSQSPDFKAKYVEPYQATFNDTVAQLRQMTTIEDGKLTQEDLETIMGGGELEAYSLIGKKFEGPVADVAKGLIRDVYSLDRVRQRALQNSRTTAMEQRKQQDTQTKARMESFKQTFEQEEETRSSREPDIFKPKEGDKERNRLLAEGEALADTILFRPKNFTDAHAAAALAEVHLRATAFPALKARVTKLESALKEREAQLAKFKGSQPGASEPDDTGGKPSKITAKPGTMEFAKQSLAQLIGA